MKRAGFRALRLEYESAQLRSHGFFLLDLRDVARGLAVKRVGLYVRWLGVLDPLVRALRK
jgi:hypothetical protein